MILSQDARNTISVIGLNMRTTSSLEALNAIIQKTFPAQTTIFKFVESLRLLESRKSCDLYQLTSGISNQHLERRRAADKKRNDKIIHYTGQLMNGEISVAVFLEAMAQRDILPKIGVYEIIENMKKNVKL